MCEKETEGAGSVPGLIACVEPRCRATPVPHACVRVCVCVAVQPYLPSSHPLQALFLDRFYAVAIPAGLILAVGVFVGSFILNVLSRSNAKKKTT